MIFANIGDKKINDEINDFGQFLSDFDQSLSLQLTLVSDFGEFFVLISVNMRVISATFYFHSLILIVL